MIEIISPAADRLGEGEAGNEQRGKSPEIYFVFFGEEINNNRAGDNPAVDSQSAAPDFKDIKRVFQVVGKFQKNMINSSTQDAAHDQPKSQIYNCFVFDVIVRSKSGSDKNGGQNTDQNKYSVPMDIYGAEREDNRLGIVGVEEVDHKRVMSNA